MGYREDNAKKIADAFARMTANADRAFQNGLERLLDFGVEMCLEEHDDKHQRHLETGDTYSWVLFHNGVEVKRKTFIQGKEVIGFADEAISKVSSSHAKGIGWEGFVIAGLKTSKDKGEATYFQVRYEFIPMRAAIKDIKREDFSKYFKAV